MDASLVVQFRSKYQYIINYSYLVIDTITRDAILIDCPWEYEKITRYIDSNGIHLRKIFLTHSHYDHTASVEQMVLKYGVAIYMSLEEMNYYNYKCDNLIGFYDLQVIHTSGIAVKSIVTPGHTMGSTCFVIDNNFFSGDTVFYEGCGVCTEVGADASMMYDSFQRIRGLISSSHILYPAHSFGKMPGSTMANVYKSNLYFNIEDKTTFINLRMRSNQSDINKFY